MKKLKRKILLTLGAATIIVTPIATVVSCGAPQDQNSNKSKSVYGQPAALSGDIPQTPTTPAIKSVPIIDIIAGKSITDKTSVNDITAQEVRDVVIKKLNTEDSPSINAKNLNSGPLDVGTTKVKLHAAGNDIDKILKYTVTSVTKNKAIRSATTLPKLGGIVDWPSENSDERAVNAITQQQILLYVRPFIDQSALASYNANIINADNLFNIGTTQVRIHAIGNDIDKILQYTVTSITKGQAMRSAADLLTLGATLTFTDQNIVDDMIAIQIHRVVDEAFQIVKGFTPTEASQIMSDRTFIVTGAKVFIWIYVHDDIGTITYTIGSVTKGEASRNKDTLPELQGTISGFSS